MKRKVDLTTYADFFLRSLDSILLVEKGTCKILEANPATKNLLDLDMAEDETSLEGTPFCNYVSKTDVNNFLKEMRMCARRHHPRSFETIISFENSEGKKKRKNIKIAACKVDLADGSNVVEMIVKDITREKEIESELQTHMMVLEYQSNYDAATNIANKRNFLKEIEKEHERFQRTKSPYSLLFMDIDNFKNYNDTNGHEAGDKCLKQVAGIIKDTVRTTDFPARYGGEEFVVICPDTDTNGAKEIAERIRKAIESADIAHREKQPLKVVSVSIGVATVPNHGSNHQELKELADDCLYQAKQAGRNKVVVSTQTYQELLDKKKKAS